MARTFEHAGGAMSSAGLSFFALFTVVPGLLLFASLAGLLIADDALRQRVIDAIVEQVPPLADVSRVVLDGLAGGAATGTIVGLLGLIWGVSGFYGALQTSMQRMFPGPTVRDIVATRIRGIAAVALVMAGLFAAVGVALVVPVVTGTFDLDIGELSAFLGPLAACAVAAAACEVVYVTVPPDGPSVREAAVPALLAGLAIGLLTTLFGLVAPLAVRGAAALGLLGAVFGALVWFDLVFQALLFGGALARLRRDRRRSKSPPRI
jgi:uncharacterized BrkB/YihY/UPF0761 family membrane protein